MNINVLEAVITFVLGGGFLSFLQFLIERKDKRKEEIKDLKKSVEDMEKRLSEKIDTIEMKADERNAINSRVRIIRFADEILEGRNHSREAFGQCLADADEYDDYCTAHPDFRNNKTTETEAFIKKIYAEKLANHDFI